MTEPNEQTTPQAGDDDLAGYFSRDPAKRAAQWIERTWHAGSESPTRIAENTVLIKASYAPLTAEVERLKVASWGACENHSRTWPELSRLASDSNNDDDPCVGCWLVDLLRERDAAKKEIASTLAEVTRMHKEALAAKEENERLRRDANTLGQLVVKLAPMAPFDNAIYSAMRLLNDLQRQLVERDAQAEAWNTSALNLEGKLAIANERIAELTKGNECCVVAGRRVVQIGEVLKGVAECSKHGLIAATFPATPPEGRDASSGVQVPDGVRWNDERGHYEEEVCAGCGHPTRLRDCGCPAGTAWRRWRGPNEALVPEGNWHAIEGANGRCACGPVDGCGERLRRHIFGLVDFNEAKANYLERERNRILEELPDVWRRHAGPLDIKVREMLKFFTGRSEPAPQPPEAQPSPDTVAGRYVPIASQVCFNDGCGRVNALSHLWCCTLCPTTHTPECTVRQQAPPQPAPSTQPSHNTLQEDCCPAWPHPPEAECVQRAPAIVEPIKYDVNINSATQATVECPACEHDTPHCERWHPPGFGNLLAEDYCEISTCVCRADFRDRALQRIEQAKSVSFEQGHTCCDAELTDLRKKLKTEQRRFDLAQSARKVETDALREKLEEAERHQRGTGERCDALSHDWLVLVFCSKCPEQFNDEQRITALMYEGKLGHHCAKSELAPVDREALREKVAALCHEQWSGWMLYLFGVCMWTQTAPDYLVMPPEQVRRWRRQMSVPYRDLTEGEKDSDRKEADRILDIIAAGGWE